MGEDRNPRQRMEARPEEWWTRQRLRNTYEDEMELTARENVTKVTELKNKSRW